MEIANTVGPLLTGSVFYSPSLEFVVGCARDHDRRSPGLGLNPEALVVIYVAGIDQGKATGQHSDGGA